MNLKLILLIILIISISIIFSTTTTKKTTKKITKKTTQKKTTNKLKLTTTKAKSNEPVSECLKSYQGASLQISENKTKCNSTCYFFKDYVGTDLVKQRGCNPKWCPGPYFAVASNTIFKFDCCNTTNCNTIDKFNSLDYSCEFFKTLQPKQKLIYPSKILSKTRVKQCYVCDDCKNPEKEAKIESCPVTDQNNYVCQYWYNKGLWNGYCETFIKALHVSFKDIKNKAVFCQTNLCNSVENMKKIENMTLCNDGFYD